MLQKPLNVVHHISRLKKKPRKMVSIDPEKAFDKIQHPFTIRTLSKLEVEGELPQLGKGHPRNTYEKCYLLSCIWFLATPWTAARWASLSFTISQSLLKLMSIESVMSSNHLTLCCPLLLLPSVFPSLLQDLSQWVGSLHQVAKVLGHQLQHQSFQY